MSTLLSLIIFSIYSFSNAQTMIGVYQQDHEFIQAIEWKGRGGLLLSQSSKEYMHQINLTLVGEEDSKMWEQKFNPENHTPHYLFNEGASYIYFIDNLDLLNNGRFYFSQINTAGNAKSGSAGVPPSSSRAATAGGTFVGRRAGDYRLEQVERSCTNSLARN